MIMISLLSRNPIRRMVAYRDRADRLAIAYLERHAVRGSITATMIDGVAAAVRREPRDLIRMIPDMRRARRYAKALAGLRAAGLITAIADDLDN